MAKNHSELINEILLLLSIEGVRVWQNQTGVARSMDGKRVITFGKKGSSDIIGIMTCKSGVGAFLAIECKTGGDVLKTHQKYFQTMIEKHGGLYIHARDTDVLSIVQSFMLNN